VGASGYALGLVLSAVLDLPTGALTVWTLALCGLLAHGWLKLNRLPAR
jgi:zinc/manganese transport system permease protein